MRVDDNDKTKSTNNDKCDTRVGYKVFIENIKTASYKTYNT